MTQPKPKIGENLNGAAMSVGLPPRPFLYTLDQLSVLFDVSVEQLKQHYLYFDRRSTGMPNRDLIIAHNIAPPHLPAEWRVGEKELVRWMRRKGFRYYDRGSVRG